MVKIMLNGQEIASGLIIEGRTYARVADLLSGLGYAYTWEPGTPNRLVIAVPRVEVGACRLGSGTNNIQLTVDFNLREFACRHCGAVKVDPVLVQKLQDLRDRIGKSITITSGYRCETHNRAVGGSPNSQHLLGKAADIVVAGMTPAVLYNHAEAVGFGGIGTYNTFVHVDTRAARARWPG